MDNYIDSITKTFGVIPEVVTIGIGQKWYTWELDLYVINISERSGHTTIYTQNDSDCLYKGYPQTKDILLTIIKTFTYNGVV